MSSIKYHLYNIIHKISHLSFMKYHISLTNIINKISHLLDTTFKNVIYRILFIENRLQNIICNIRSMDFIIQNIIYLSYRLSSIEHICMGYHLQKIIFLRVFSSGAFTESNRREPNALALIVTKREQCPQINPCLLVVRSARVGHFPRMNPFSFFIGVKTRMFPITRYFPACLDFDKAFLLRGVGLFFF